MDKKMAVRSVDSTAVLKAEKKVSTTDVSWVASRVARKVQKTDVKRVVSKVVQ